MNTEAPHLDLSKIFQAINEARALAFRSLWDSFMPLIMEHWVAVVLFLTVILVIAVLRAISGYWGMLGSVLYNYLFFGTLFVVGLILGPEVFANNYIKVGLVLLYVICFLMVGRILDWTGLRRRYQLQ